MMKFEEIVKKHPLGSKITGKVIANFPFGSQIDIGEGNYWGILETIHFPNKNNHEKLIYPEIGTTIEAIVIQHDESSNQIRISQAERIYAHYGYT